MKKSIHFNPNPESIPYVSDVAKGCINGFKYMQVDFAAKPTLLMQRPPVNNLQYSKSNMRAFEEMIEWVKRRGAVEGFTSKGFLKYTNDELREGLIMWVRQTGNEYIFIFNVYSLFFAIEIGCGRVNEGISGTSAFARFREFDKDGVLKKIAVSEAEGRKISEHISGQGFIIIDSIVNMDSRYKSPALNRFRLLNQSGIKVKKAFHVDANSAYPFGVGLKYPKVGKVFDEIEAFYPHDRAKEIENKFIGFCDSPFLGAVGFEPYGLVKITREAWLYCSSSIIGLAREMNRKGYLILAINTDGIFAVARDGVPEIWQGSEAYPLGDKKGQYKVDYYGGDIYLYATHWLYRGGYKKGESNVFDKAIRGNFSYRKKKAYEDWDFADCKAALEANSTIFVSWDYPSQTLNYGESKSPLTYKLRFADKTEELKKGGISLI